MMLRIVGPASLYQIRQTIVFRPVEPAQASRREPRDQSNWVRFFNPPSPRIQSQDPDRSIPTPSQLPNRQLGSFFRSTQPDRPPDPNWVRFFIRVHSCSFVALL